MSLEGQTLGEFEILSRIGQGGMGAVYKARQISLKRLVALKTLQASLASDAEFIARFQREAIAAASLNHPNLVQVHSAGETDGLHWFAMEFIEGESAKTRLTRKGRLDLAEAVAIAIHIATALEYGWRKAQLIHRDIKPDNIFLSNDGEVKLGDLGLAKSVGGATAEVQSLTMTGSSMGTPHYISPEQGQGRKDVDFRADIYSLGCTLYHLAGGQPPYSGDTALAVMMQHVTAPVPNLALVLPGCPQSLAVAVMKMMAKDPAHRQQSYAEILADLRRAYDEVAGASVPSVVAVTLPQGRAASPKSPANPRPAKQGAFGESALPVPAAPADIHSAQTVVTPAGGGAPNPQSPIRNPKSKAPLLVALAAGVAVLAAVLFLVFGKKEPQLTEAERAEKARAGGARPPGALPSADSSTNAPGGRVPPPAASPSPTAWQPLFTDAKWRLLPPVPGKMEFKDGLLHLTGSLHNQEQESPDGAIRTTIRVRDGSTSLGVFIRNGAKGTYQFDVQGVGGTGDSALKYFPPASSAGTVLGTYTLPKPLQVNDVLRLELRAVGDHLEAFVNGIAAIDLRDSRIKSRGKWGVKATDGWFESVEVQPLPAPVSTPTSGSKLGDVKTWPKRTTPVLEIAGHRYQGVVFGCTWIEAKREAEQLGGHLATFETEAEELALRDRLFAALSGVESADDPSTKLYWIGGHVAARSRDLRWITGGPVGKVKWRGGNPEWREKELKETADTGAWFAAGMAVQKPGDDGKWVVVQAEDWPRSGFIVEWDNSAVSTPTLPISKSSDPKFPPGQWVKLFTKPEDLPADLRKPDSGVTWENGWISADNGKAIYIDNGRLWTNAGIRFRTRITDHRHTVASIRDANPADKTGHHYQFRADTVAHAWALDYFRDAKPKATTEPIGQWPVQPGELSEGKEFLLELAAVNNKIIARGDSRLLGVVTDSRISSGRLAPFILSPVRDIEVINLDGLPEAEALRLLGVDEQGNDIRGKSAAAEPWQDLLRTPGSLKLNKAQITAEGLRMETTGWALVDNDSREKNGALKMRAPFSQNAGPHVCARVSADGTTEYRLRVVDASRVLLERRENASATVLREFPVSPPLIEGDDYELELRVVGSILSAKLNGRLLGETEDATYKAGAFKLDHGDPPITVKALHFLPLAPKPAVSASPSLPVSKSSVATATKDAPFVNSLGMKFVPVPGTKVLFSVWDTRVQDYEKYAAAKPGVNGEWKTQQKDGVPVGREKDHPVVGVSWDDAQAFCAWLTEKERKEPGRPRPGNETRGEGAPAPWVYRLPTDAEWSTAAGLPPEQGATPEEKSGKNDVDFPWGKEWPPTKKVGNYADESFHEKFPAKKNERDNSIENQWMKDYADGWATTSPVGSFPMNAFGLYDMGGNAWQWVEDWHDASQKARVTRGGGWTTWDRPLFTRGSDAPGIRRGTVGFRCVLDPAPSAAAPGRRAVKDAPRGNPPASSPGSANR